MVKSAPKTPPQRQAAAGIDTQAASPAAPAKTFADLIKGSKTSEERTDVTVPPRKADAPDASMPAGEEPKAAGVEGSDADRASEVRQPACRTHAAAHSVAQVATSSAPEEAPKPSEDKKPSKPAWNLVRTPAHPRCHHHHHGLHYSLQRSLQ